jgi:hypothetical protein
MNRREVLAGLGLVTLGAAVLPGCGKSSEDGDAQFLMVQSAYAAKLENGVLRLDGVSPSTMYFSDRPERIVGHLPTKFFADYWNEGETFNKVPPNAALSILETEAVEDVVVVLKSMRIEGHDAVYEVDVLEGPESLEGGANGLFIDNAGQPATPHSAAGHHRRTKRRHEKARH